MGLWPAWFNVYCIIGSILVTIVLFGFIIQTFIHKYIQKDELTTTYSVLATIGLVKILSSCASSYVFTCSTMVADIDTFYLLTSWLNFIRIIALFSHMLFFVWRLELTFIRTNYQLSNAGLICYHVILVVSLILHAILQAPNIPYNTFIYMWYIAQLMRLGVFFAVSYQFMNKLFDLIANQHNSNTEPNTQKHTRLITAARKNHSRDTNVNQQLLNQLKGELKLMIESQMDNSSFTEKNYKLISVITKLSFLTCIDFITLFLYVTISEIYNIAMENEIELYVLFCNLMYTMEPLCFFLFSLTVWFSFTFADKQYLCIFGCCHRRFMQYFEKRAKKRTVNQQVAALSKFSPIFGESKEKSVNSRTLELECSVMQD